MKKTVHITLGFLFTVTQFFAQNNIDLVLDFEDQKFLPCMTVLKDKLGRNYFYVANKAGGVFIFESPNGNVSNSNQVKHIPSSGIFGEFEGQHINNMYQEGNYLYLATGNFFGSTQRPGLAIIDITNPENAAVLDNWIMPIDSSSNRGAPVVEVYGDYAYLGGTYDGLIILDVSDKESIEMVSQYIPDINFPIPNPGPFMTPAARGLTVVDDDLLVLCYDAGGIRIIDITNKQNPIEIGRYINLNVPDNHAYNNVVVSDNIAFVGVDYCGVEVLDITNPQEIERISWWNPYGCEEGGHVWLEANGHINELVYLSEMKLLFMSAGDDELLVLNVEDLSNPYLVGQYGEADNEHVVWGLDTDEENIYLGYIVAPETQYTAFSGTWSGVKVLSYDYTLSLLGNTFSTSPLVSFPNPSNGRFNIDLPNTPSYGSLMIYDFFGKLVYDSYDEAFPVEIDISECKSGIYLVKVFSAEGELIGEQKLLRH